jgi:hypothetical protein
MPVTVQKLTAPRILLTGTRILENNGVITTQAVVNLDVGNLVEQTTTTLNGHTVTEVISAPVVKFASDVTVAITTVYPLKAMAAIPVGAHVVIGDYPDIPYNLDKAAIYYTVSGKDPKRTKNVLYLQPIVITQNETINDNTLLKAKVYREGNESDVMAVNIIIVNV